MSADSPVKCALSLPLRQENAALNLYGDAPGAFTDDAITTAAIIAAQTTGILALYRAEQKCADLEIALEGNRVIGAAIGILMHAHRITSDDAFVMLRDKSAGFKRKLRDVADEVVQSGVLPDHPSDMR